MENSIRQTIIVDPKWGEPEREATIEIPAGWYRVLSGGLKPGDRYLAVDLFWETGEIAWLEPEGFPPAAKIVPTAEDYDCVIRRGEPVEMLCPRCHCRPVRLGYRYCKNCSYASVTETRRRPPADSE